NFQDDEWISCIQALCRLPFAGNSDSHILNPSFILLGSQMLNVPHANSIANSFGKNLESRCFSSRQAEVGTKVPNNKAMASHRNPKTSILDSLHPCE
ncbi:MAG: hypothetical protein ACLFUS_11040, partial [Candidatus Sumerlaeia bacterium]